MCDIESWCKVESNSKGEWLKSERKHCPKALCSDIFGLNQPCQDDTFRSEWINAKPEEEKRREKRHFPEKAVCHLK
ncbi:protein SPATA45 homolog [Corticium candelabrum]|uniref:protein SPATA45 homolog n=1 Tax=Corticium candelabrum TaxID=121492 RepID=UPI002E261C00|nr:protein SPATA45 homolog [Corticium candelabrum]